jgi:hypothetical protein
VIEPYEIALKKAGRALAELDAKAMEIERERAKLRQTVAVLRSQLGLDAESIASLTDAIVLIIKGSPGCLRTPDILNRLTAMGYEPSRTSVSTLLSRLTRQGKITGRRSDEGLQVYEWNTQASRVERENPRREVADNAKKK